MKRTNYYTIILLMQFYFVGLSHAGDKVNQSIDLGGSRQATWYLPDGEAQGWMLLQHGFQRNKSNLDDFATHLMDNGLMVLTINSSVSNGNPSLAREIADDLVDNPPIPPNNRILPNQLVIAGHSAGGLFMSYLGGRLVERDYLNLSGVLLFDPVDKNNGMQPNLQSVIDFGKPVLSILANSSSCNSSNNAMTPLNNLSDAFVGIKLTDNSKHTDVEGSSTGGIITWICGSPKSHNIDYLQDFALHWAKDMISGSISADYYPGGSKLQQLIADNDGVLIKEITLVPPTADFNYLIDGLSVDFTNSSSEGDAEITNYEWSFGDGQTSVNESPMHSYAAYGDYNITLKVTDANQQTDSISKMISLQSDTTPPSADFSYSASQLSVNFSDSSSDPDGTITSYFWQFGDGATSSQANPTHVYAESGSYLVQLEVTDNDGLRDQIEKSITLTEDPDGPTELFDGSQITELSAPSGGELHFVMRNVPPNTNQIQFQISGGSGDADIYVRFNEAPTQSQYDYRPYLWGNNETVNISNPATGDWYVMIRAYQAFSEVSLSAQLD